MSKTKSNTSARKKGELFKHEESSARKRETSGGKTPVPDYDRRTPQNERIEAPSRTLTKQPEKKPFVDNYDLPAKYNETRLTLLIKDPLWIFAYWDITPGSIAALRKRIGDEVDRSQVILRLYDVTHINFDGTNANNSFDLDVGAHSNNWYINIWCDNVTYCGEIGMRTPAGRFHPLARSNFIHIPRAGYSPRTENIWMKVTDQNREVPYVLSKTGNRAPTKQRHIPQGQKKRIYLSEDDIKQYYSGLTPLLRNVISYRLETLHRRDYNSVVLEGETEEERKKILEWLPRGTYVKKVLIGSSEMLIMPGASEQLAIGASEFLHERKKDKFFFELGTELIVYGRTEPDAEVWLGDKKIQLRNDGTFSLRYFLPDGKIPLEFTAISKNKSHKRKIATVVERKTTKDS